MSYSHIPDVPAQMKIKDFGCPLISNADIKDCSTNKYPEVVKKLIKESTPVKSNRKPSDAL